MDATTARAILSETAAGGWLDRDLPEDESELVELAKYFVDEAKLALDDGMDNEHIRAIINLGSNPTPPVLSEVAGHDDDGTPPGETTSDDWQYTEEKVRKTYPRRSSGGFSESDLREVEGLPIPPAVEAAYSQEMPVDLTELGDKAVRKLYSAFNSYLGRARWKLALASSNLSNATHLRDDAYRVSYLKVLRETSSAGEKLTQAALEAVAKDTEEYKEWSDRVNEYNAEVTNWKALVEIYGGNVDRLSREWTMRTEQYERER